MATVFAFLVVTDDTLGGMETFRPLAECGLKFLRSTVCHQSHLDRISKQRYDEEYVWF